LATTAVAALRERGVKVEVWYTRRVGHGVELARQGYEQGFRDFIAVGGDGTSHEIVNGLDGAMGEIGEARASLSFLPLGTGNSFIRDFGSSDADAMAAKITLDKRRPCDVIRVHHDDGVLYFINIFSFGYVADVCRMANTQFKKLGSSGYAVAALAQLSTLEPVTYAMQLDDTPQWSQPAMVVSINNSQFTGGHMHIAPYADATDGELDVLVVGALTKTTFMRLFVKLFSGEHVHHSAVIMSRARHIRFAFDAPLDVMVDGEVLRMRPREMEVLPGALDIVV
jgi:YegS/Rv2252/BmrU family lipid kinase